MFTPKGGPLVSLIFKCSQLLALASSPNSFHMKSFELQPSSQLIYNMNIIEKLAVVGSVTALTAFGVLTYLKPKVKSSKEDLHNLR